MIAGMSESLTKTLREVISKRFNDRYVMISLNGAESCHGPYNDH